MAVIKLTIKTCDIEDVLTQFNSINIYRSTTTIDGAYSLLGTIPLSASITTYEYIDNNGDESYYYKTSYFHSTTLIESDLSAPIKGEDETTANIMTVGDLKNIYLFGIDLTDEAGNPFPDIIFEWSIRWAIANVERELDIRIRPTDLVERYDYYRNDYLNWTIIKLRESPVVKVDKVEVTWPSGSTVIEFPQEWIQVRKDAGQVNIVPTSGTLSQVLLTAGGSFLPLVASGRDFVPNILQVTYTAGFAEGEVPIELRDLIGKWAAFGPLNIAGDLVVGAGIAAKSLTIDGLSQSINSTSSATNAGYGARLHQYMSEIKQVVPTLRRYYKGIKLQAL